MRTSFGLERIFRVDLPGPCFGLEPQSPRTVWCGPTWLAGSGLLRSPPDVTWNAFRLTAATWPRFEQRLRLTLLRRGSTPRGWARQPGMARYRHRVGSPGSTR